MAPDPAQTALERLEREKGAIPSIHGKAMFLAGYRASVADTEREHEPAERTVWTCMSCGHITESQCCDVCGREAMPGRWVSADTSGFLRAFDAEHHAEVLAKALDQFFREITLDCWGSPEGMLRAATWPTLQALGYPKEGG